MRLISYLLSLIHIQMCIRDRYSSFSVENRVTRTGQFMNDPPIVQTRHLFQNVLEDFATIAQHETDVLMTDVCLDVINDTATLENTTKAKWPFCFYTDIVEFGPIENCFIFVYTILFSPYNFKLTRQMCIRDRNIIVL